MSKTNKFNITFIIFSLLFTIALLKNNNLSYAQESDKDATKSSQKITTQNLKEYVNNAIKILGLSTEKKTAIIGEVTRVTDETITINSRLGTRIIPIENTNFIKKNNKEIKISDIAVENWVTVLGQIVDDNFTPVFLYVYNESLLPKNQYVKIGTITKSDRTSFTINPRSGENEETIIFSNKTDFEDINGIEITPSDLEKDITVLVSGFQTETKIEALTIRSLAPIADSSEGNK